MFILSLSSLKAQDAFLRELATEVCHCLNENESDLTESSATGCLATVATRNKKELRHRYDLIASDAYHRDLLAEYLVDDLLAVCPILRTIRPEEVEREFRWADSREGIKHGSPAFNAPKRPPADSSNAITSEPPAVWRATGVLLAQPGSKGLRLRTEEGKEMTFDLPAAVVRRRDFDPGDTVSLSYRREWHVRENQIVLVVLDIDE
jgi:hypothetical protein